MEDEHVHKLCLNDEKDTHYFAVFDGHGGQGAAQYAAKQLDLSIINHNAFRKFVKLVCYWYIYAGAKRRNYCLNCLNQMTDDLCVLKENNICKNT